MTSVYECSSCGAWCDSAHDHDIIECALNRERNKQLAEAALPAPKSEDGSDDGMYWEDALMSKQEAVQQEAVVKAIEFFTTPIPGNGQTQLEFYRAHAQSFKERTGSDNYEADIKAADHIQVLINIAKKEVPTRYSEKYMNEAHAVANGDTEALTKVADRIITAARPCVGAVETIDIDYLYRQMTGYGGDTIDWQMPIANFIRCLVERYPNGVKLVRNET